MSQKYDVQINFYINKELEKKLDEIVKSEFSSRSSVLRKMIAEKKL